MLQKSPTSVGRRKCSTCRAMIKPAEDGQGKIVVNGKDYITYFRSPLLHQKVMKPLVVTERVGTYDFRLNVIGGGSSGQAGAVLHAIARVLEKVEPELRPALKKAGLLTRDPRAVERKKAGRHKARRSTQFSKR